jgi:hypothetical protein
VEASHEPVRTSSRRRPRPPRPPSPCRPRAAPAELRRLPRPRSRPTAAALALRGAHPIAPRRAVRRSWAAPGWSPSSWRWRPSACGAPRPSPGRCGGGGGGGDERPGEGPALAPERRTGLGRERGAVAWCSGSSRTCARWRASATRGRRPRLSELRPAGALAGAAVGEGFAVDHEGGLTMKPRRRAARLAVDAGRSPAPSARRGAAPASACARGGPGPMGPDQGRPHGPHGRWGRAGTIRRLRRSTRCSGPGGGHPAAGGARAGASPTSWWKKIRDAASPPTRMSHRPGARTSSAPSVALDRALAAADSPEREAGPRQVRRGGQAELAVRKNRMKLLLQCARTLGPELWQKLQAREPDIRRRAARRDAWCGLAVGSRQVTPGGAGPGARGGGRPVDRRT